MSLEKSLERIAVALEVIAKLAEEANKDEAPAVVAAASSTAAPAPAADSTAAPVPVVDAFAAIPPAPAAPPVPPSGQGPVPPAAPPAPPAKSKGKKPAGPKVEYPKDVAGYQAYMKDVSKRIAAFTGDGEKTNALFAKLQVQFKKKFKDSEHVFDVQPANYDGVCTLVDAFLKKEGIQ